MADTESVTARRSKLARMHRGMESLAPTTSPHRTRGRHSRNSGLWGYKRGAPTTVGVPRILFDHLRHRTAPAVRGTVCSPLVNYTEAWPNRQRTGQILPCQLHPYRPYRDDEEASNAE